MNEPLDRQRGQWISGPLLLLGVAAGYLGLAEFVIWLDDAMNLGTGFWPAAGLSLGLLLLVSPSRWGWVIAGIAVAELGGDLAHGHPLDAALWFTAGNCIEPLIVALLLRRWGNPSGSLVPLRQFRRFFVAGVVVGPLVGGSIGWIGTVVALGHMGAWEAWPRYVLADAVGVLVVAPMLLCWKEQRIVRHLGETATLAAVLLAVTFVEFGTWGDVWDTALPYPIIPLLMWAALRHGCRGAVACRLHGRPDRHLVDGGRSRAIRGRRGGNRHHHHPAPDVPRHQRRVDVRHGCPRRGSGGPHRSRGAPRETGIDRRADRVAQPSVTDVVSERTPHITVQSHWSGCVRV